MSRNKKLYLGITIIVIISLSASGLYAYIESTTVDDKSNGNTEPEKEIDNQVSPLTNQGLCIEILRIRHRGLLDKLMTPGNSWKATPEFYFITNLDGVEYVSKNVAGGAAQAGTFETPFTDWDTMFQENKVFRKAGEEQETSKVTLTILENVKSGLLGLKSTDVEKEKLTLTYDYRTGRWDGKDDLFMDSDGYGHYVGETFEVWFNIYQTDYDHDGIPYWTEVNVLGTDPTVDDSKLDPDGDGIPTSWEWKWGYDPNTWDDHMFLDPDIDGIQNIEEYQMAKWFADPYSKDMYIEADFMESNGIFDPVHVFWKESQQAIIELYAQHGINVYIDDGWADGPKNGGGELVTHYEKVSQDSGMMLQYYNHHFADERKGIFRYLVVAHNSGFNHPQKFNQYDTLTVGTAPSKLLKRKAITPRLKYITLASGVMHELGHTIGISPWTHEGCDNISYAHGMEERKHYIETWGQYVSVMNYFYIFDHKVIGYSDGSNGAPYDQNDWMHYYLPSFQIEARVFEEAFFSPPCVEKIVDEPIELEVNGWGYDEEITEQFRANYVGISPVSPIEVEWFVMVKTDEASQLDDRDVRVYAKPVIEPGYSEWTLSWEGCLDDQNNVGIYSIQNEVDLVIQQINEME